MIFAFGGLEPRGIKYESRSLTHNS